jgi:hypothetical protein
MSERVTITVSLTMNGGRSRQDALALHLLSSLHPVLGTDGWYGIEPGSVSAFIANPTTEDRTQQEDPHS